MHFFVLGELALRYMYRLAETATINGSYHMPSRAVARQPFAVRSQLPDLLLF
jgi:hypothetical protein